MLGTMSFLLQFTTRKSEKYTADELCDFGRMHLWLHYSKTQLLFAVTCYVLRAQGTRYLRSGTGDPRSVPISVSKPWNLSLFLHLLLATHLHPQSTLQVGKIYYSTQLKGED